YLQFLFLLFSEIVFGRHRFLLLRINKLIIRYLTAQQLSKLLLTANDGVNKTELWVLSLADNGQEAIAFIIQARSLLP
ncbi:hypothetical protein NDA00_27665, partial [Funiculus sociatus GB2-M2]|uniref:hypothetical protein n=1 Tax=Cyanophyceae TaxID=3028117 RepID=UPI001A7EF8B5